MKLPYGLIYGLVFIGVFIWELSQFSFERCISINMPLFVALMSIICAFGLCFEYHCSSSL